MIKSFRCGISNESSKYIYGNQFRFDDSIERTFFKDKRIRLTAAKNDSAAFQVFLEAGEDFILAVTDNTVFHPMIELPVVRLEVDTDSSGIRVESRLEGFIEDDDRCLKADLLLHDEFTHVKRDVCQPVWIEINVPCDFGERIVNGEINLYVHTMFSDEVKVDSLKFEIEVMGVNMPDPRDYKFYLNLWQHLSNISRKHGVPLWSDEHFRVLDYYTRSMAELGQKVITMVVSEVPWSGQFCFDIKSHLSNLFEYNIIRVEKGEDGSLNLDFTAMDRYVEMCFEYGIDKEIEIIGLVNVWCKPERGFGNVAEDYPDAVRIRYYDRKEKKFRFLSRGDDIKEYIQKLEAHFIEKGWIDIVRVMADEPSDEEKYQRSIDAVRKAAPCFKFKIAINHASFIKKFKDEITDFVPFIASLFEEWDTYKEMKSRKTGRYLWYTCCGISPDSCIRASLLESRFIGWLTAYLGLEGFLRWNYTVWPDNPKTQIYWNYPLFPAGENNFVYPGSDGRPVLSLRYKHLKRGIQDFELIRMIRESHPQSEKILERVFNKVIKSEDITKTRLFDPSSDKSKILSFNYDDYNEARRELLMELECLKG